MGIPNIISSRVYTYNIIFGIARLNFVYLGHRVKIKVTGAKQESLCIMFAGGLPSIERQSLFYCWCGSQSVVFQVFTLHRYNITLLGNRIAKHTHITIKTVGLTANPTLLQLSLCLRLQQRAESIMFSDCLSVSPLSAHPLTYCTRCYISVLTAWWKHFSETWQNILHLFIYYVHNNHVGRAT